MGIARASARKYRLNSVVRNVKFSRLLVQGELIAASRDAVSGGEESRALRFLVAGKAPALPLVSLMMLILW